MALLIDTDLLIDLERAGRAEEVEQLLGDEERAISVITAASCCTASWAQAEPPAHDGARS